MHNFLSSKATEMNLAPMRFSRQAGSNDVHDDLGRSNCDLTSGQGQIKVMFKVRKVILHKMCFVMTRQAYWWPFHICITTQSRVTSHELAKKETSPLMTSSLPQLTLYRSMLNIFIGNSLVWPQRTCLGAFRPHQPPKQAIVAAFALKCWILSTVVIFKK